MDTGHRSETCGQVWPEDFFFPHGILKFSNLLPIFKNEEEVLTQILDFWFPQTTGSGDMRLRSGSLLEGLHWPSHHCFLLPAWPGGFQFLRNEKQVDEKLRFLPVRTRRGRKRPGKAKNFGLKRSIEWAQCRKVKWAERMDMDMRRKEMRWEEN